jgi:hypothetical protein
LPKAIAEGTGDNGVSRVVPVPAHMSDVQFTVMTIPVAPLHPPKASLDALGKKKKKKDKDGKETPVPRVNAPVQVPLRTGAVGRPPTMTSPPSLGNRAPTASVWKPSDDSKSRMEGFRSAVAAPSAVRATMNSAQASIVHTPAVQPPPAPASVPSSTPAAAPAPPPKPITICKELASLLGTPVPRSAASPVLRPGSAQDDKKRKREEESVSMVTHQPRW